MNLDLTRQDCLHGCCVHHRNVQPTPLTRSRLVDRSVDHQLSAIRINPPLIPFPWVASKKRRKSRRPRALRRKCARTSMLRALSLRHKCLCTISVRSDYDAARLYCTGSVTVQSNIHPPTWLSPEPQPNTHHRAPSQPRVCRRRSDGGPGVRSRGADRREG